MNKTRASIRGGLVASLLTTMSFGATVPAVECDPETGEALRKTVEASLMAFQNENLNDALRFVHSKSSEYAQFREKAQHLFKAVDVKAELLQFDYIGHEREFAAARAKIKTTAAPGSEFQDNITDIIYIFDLEDGRWKYWASTVLGTEFIGPQGAL